MDGQVATKRILITGKNSYIGTRFKAWLEQFDGQYQMDELSVSKDGWQEVSFAGYDAVLHVAGIAHVSSDPKLEPLYYQVNRDLAVEVAEKAKRDCVQQIVFMSSMIVYGGDGKIGTPKMISLETKPEPDNFYGNSKLMAEQSINKLADEHFVVTIIRAPMVYGPGCKGNFPKLMGLARRCPVFPCIENQRSMIFIDNLCEFLRLLIVHRKAGIFFPQNQAYVSTQDIVVTVRELLGKRTFLVRIFNPLMRLLSRKISVIDKVLGNKTYVQEMSLLEEPYCVVDFRKSIELSSELKRERTVM